MNKFVPSHKEEEYFIVKVKMAQVKAFDKSIMTKEGTIGYLAESEGYAAIDREKTRAKQFDKHPTADMINQWNGCPWYCVIRSATVIKVKRTITVEYSESKEMEPL